MSPHANTEDQLVEQPAIGLYATLVRQTLKALDEVFGAACTLSPGTKSEVEI